MSRVVIKLGGSLLDLPDLVERVDRILARCEDDGEMPLLLVGGGRAADLVRSFDANAGLDEKAGHWLAVRAMALNARCLAAVVPRTRLVADRRSSEDAWRFGDRPVVEPFEWLRREEAAGVRNPHVWSFTSDSIAAHLGRRVRVRLLLLLKSTLPGNGCDVHDAARAGIVDARFPEACEGVGRIELLNLRDPSFPRCVLRSDRAAT